MDRDAQGSDYASALYVGCPQWQSELLRPDGANRWTAIDVQHWVTPYRDKEGGFFGLINGWIDITERERLHRQLQEAKQQADEANRAKSVFLATISYEIRTPINAIIGMLELVLKRLDPRQRECKLLMVASDAAQSLLLLIGDVLDVAKIESGCLVLVPERVLLVEIVESVRRIFDGLVRQKSIQLTVESDSTSEVMIDPLRFKQVLSNLVSNAIKFTETGQVHIRLREKDVGDGRLIVRLEVEDSGIGVVEEDQAYLFQPFIQISKRGTAQGGTGLGLVICRKLIDMMGGDIELRSELGKGTQASLNLMLRALNPLPLSPSVAVDSGLIIQKPMRPLAILVVDNYSPNRLLLRQQLEHLGHRVKEAEDDLAALGIWSSTAFDLVITDCSMPQLNGYRLSRCIRQEERQMRRSPCLIIGYTANAQPNEIQRCRRAGMDDCLFKPARLDTLRNCLAQLYKLPYEQTGEGDDTPYRVSKLHRFFNLRALTSLSSGQPKQVHHLLKEVLGSNRLDLERLSTILREGDRVRLGNHAHQIKGAASLIGARALQAACVTLERACHNDESQEHLREQGERGMQVLEHLQTELQDQLSMVGVA